MCPPFLFVEFMGANREVRRAISLEPPLDDLREAAFAAFAAFAAGLVSRRGAALAHVANGVIT